MQRRVIKLGGSLLDFANLREALRRWLAAQADAATVLIVGGGGLVEAIRHLDRRLAIGEVAAHWLCLRAMGVSARMAEALWPEFLLATQFEETMRLLDEGRGPIIFDTLDFLLHEEPRLPGVALAHNWTVTSDSIAARVAEVISADELVLLKSILPASASVTCDMAAAAGYVDLFFPRAARGLSQIRAVDLRSADFRQTPLRIWS